ncbi:MAG: cytidine deaminase [Anaerolineaceae bacterium]
MLKDEVRQQLIQAAMLVRRWAYAPYSHYAVGAAVLTSSGKIYDGVNVESAAYPSGICGERVAIFKAVSEGEREFEALAVVTENGGTPCGSCRQVMAEFSLDMLVLIANPQGEVLREMTVAELLPGAFTPRDLSVHQK